MRRLRRLIPLALAAVVAAGGGYYLFSYPAPPVDPAWQLAPTKEVPPGAVTVRFSGTATLLFDDGDTAWMVDGWFSRPGLLRTLFGRIAPDMQAIDLGLARNDVKELAAVIPAHSHYDHAMDAPEVARRTGALLIGSKATANIGRGWGLPEDRIRVVADGDRIALGDFRIRFIESRHMPYPEPRLVEALISNSEIPGPLVPPARMLDYKLGKAWILQVEHPKGSVLVVGSAGFRTGQLQQLGVDVDTVFLGVGGLGGQSRGYRAAYWRQTVEASNAERVIPIHYDSLIGPLDAPMTGEMRLVGLLAGSEQVTLEFLRKRAVKQPQRVISTLPRFQPVVLFP